MPAPFIHEEAWRKTFEGYVIVDCAARSRDIVYLVIRQSLSEEESGELLDSDIPTRFVAIFLDQEDPPERWAHQGLADFRRPICGACRKPIGQGMAISINGDVFASGSKKTGMEEIVVDGQPTSIERVRCIADHAYTVGLLREVYRRAEVGKWEALSAGLPPVEADGVPVERLNDFGFRDIDGFATDDLYAVGGKGEVWRYDGHRWRPGRFPDQVPLFAVCCGADQQVYVSAEGQTLYRGSGDRWERVHQGQGTDPYHDLRWFQGRLWMSSRQRFDQLVDGQVRPVPPSDRQKAFHGHLDTAEGLLVIATQDSVDAFDGRAWRPIVRPY